VLAAVASTLARHVGADDAAGRIGAEEFALLLPGAALEATVAVAERMRLAAEAQAIANDGRPVMFTMSFGCTAVADAARDLPDKPAATTLEGLLREADAALYEAQGTGGNRSIAWPAYQALRALRLGAPAASGFQSLA
jgi:diguanylate cyclase (GGDEF)-like protein